MRLHIAAVLLLMTSSLSAAKKRNSSFQPETAEWNSGAELALSSRRLLHCLSACTSRGWCAGARFTDSSECGLLLPAGALPSAPTAVGPVHRKLEFAGERKLPMFDCKQSTVWGPSTLCGNAMDGDVSQAYATCFSTANGPNQWWEASTGDEAFITKVALYNRGECCQQRLDNFIISVDGVTCVDFVTATSFMVSNFTCRRRGTALRVTSRLTNILTICEVTAYGFV